MWKGGVGGVLGRGGLLAVPASSAPLSSKKNGSRWDPLPAGPAAPRNASSSTSSTSGAWYSGGTACNAQSQCVCVCGMGHGVEGGVCVCVCVCSVPVRSVRASCTWVLPTAAKGFHTWTDRPLHAVLRASKLAMSPPRSMSLAWLTWTQVGTRGPVLAAGCAPRSKTCGMTALR